MAYTIISGARKSVESVDLVAAVASAAQHAGSGETTVEDGEGTVVATIERGAMIDRPGGLVAVIHDGTETEEDTRVDLSQTESEAEARAILRSALGQ